MAFAASGLRPVATFAIFSPAVIRSGTRFCSGGSGHVVNFEDAQSGLYAKFISNVTTFVAVSIAAWTKRNPYVSSPLVSSLNVK